MRVAGLDVSMTATGWCVLEGYGGIIDPIVAQDHGLVKSKPTVRYLKPGRKVGSKMQRDYMQRHDEVAARIQKIVDEIEIAIGGWGDFDLIVVESPSLNSKSSSLDKLWGTYWATLARLSSWGAPIATVSPRARAQYATGNGSSNKESVVDATVTTYELSYRDDNEVDATLLAAMGMRHLHAPVETYLPKSHRDALSAVLWPTNKEIA